MGSSGRFKRAPAISRRKKKDSKTLDLTEIVSCYAVGFMLYRIVVLLQLLILAPDTPPSSQYNNANWLDDINAKSVAAVDYSQLKGIRSSSGRTFLKYVSSPWEIKWSTSMDDFVRTDTVCHQIAFDTDLMRQFFNATCTSMMMMDDNDEQHKNHQGWCILDDTVQPLFFNVGSGKISGSKPGVIKGVEFEPAQPVSIATTENNNNKNDIVFSKFLYRDHASGQIVTDYVEPLISRLRHPLDCCEHAYQLGVNFKKTPPNCLATKRLGVTRTQFLPPSSHARASTSMSTTTTTVTSAHYFDSGSWHWKLGKSALTYVSQVWKRHGIDFDHYHVYEATAKSKDKFLQSVPAAIQHDRRIIDYRAADPTNRTDFIYEIVTQTTPDDYVLLKLDFQNDPVEELRVLNELLANRLSVLDYLDELLYTVPIVPVANVSSANAMEYGPWYQRFLQLRQAGVRAHSFTKDL